MAGASAGIGAIGHGDTIAHTLHLNPSSGHGKQLHDIFGQDDQVIKEGPHAGQNLRIIKDGQGKVTQEYYSNDGKHLLERDTPDGAKYKYDNYSHRLKTQEIGDEKITYRGDGKTIATKDNPHENVIYNEDGSLDVVENKEAHTIAWYKEYNNKNVTVRYQDAGKKEVIEYDDTGNTVTKHTIDGKDVLHTSPPAEARPSAPAGAKVEPAEGTRPPSSGNGQKPAPNTDKEAIKNIKAHLDANRVGTPHPPRVPGGTGEDVQAGQRVDNTPPPQTSPVTEKTLLGGNALTDKRFMENYRAGHKGGLLGDDIFKFERYTNSSHVGHTETPLPMHEVVSHPDIDFNGQTYVYHRTDLEGDHYISLDDRQEYVVRTDHPEITINQAVPATAPSVSGVQPGGVPTTISNEDMLANGRPLPKTPTRANFLDDAPRSRPTIPSSPAYHAETHTELERSFDKHDLAVEDIPKDDHIHGMTYSEWNHASDQMLSRTPFSTPDDYAREDAMQRVFGSGHKEFITTTPGGAPTEHVALTRYDFTYKNNLDALQKTPAKDFVALMRGDYIDKAEIPRLKNLGFLDDKGKPLAWEGKHEFERLTRSFGKVTSHPEPYPDETMREYIGRITKKIHEARDGTIYSIKDGAIRVRHVSQTSYAREYGEPAVYNGYKYNGGMSHPVEMTTGGDYGYGEYYPGNRGVDAGIRVINSRYGGGYGSYGTGF